jgi:REP element-mobilizing transposase RayT
MIPLESDNFYHVYNRANGNEKIFADEGNYHFFLSKYINYISPIAHSYCYCLMPNHFHFLVKIKKEQEVRNFFNRTKNLQGFQNPAGLVSNQFSKFFNSYVKAFNKQQSRKGSLFMKNFKRKKITDEKYLRKLVHYIHYNPVEAYLCRKPTEWKFSSYNELIDEKINFLAKNEVISWFEDKENFIYCHSYPPKETGIE